MSRVAAAHVLKARWTRLTLPSCASNPCARSSHKISAINGKAYVFGGEATARHAIDSALHVFDLSAGSASWQRVAPSYAPTARVGHAQATVDGKLLVFGGRSGINMGESELRDLWEFDPAEGAWTEVESDGGEPPSARSFHAATAVADRLFVFGGCGADGRLADLYAFCSTTRRWSALPSPPDLPGRGGATLEATADGKYLWLVGGFVGHETNDMLRFCLRSSTWERRPSEWLRPRSVSASFAVQSAVCVFGGEVSPSDRGHEGAGGFAADLVAFDPENGGPRRVHTEGEAPAARGWSSATTLSDSEVLLFGGLAGSDETPERLGDTWLLNVEGHDEQL
jgi:hypothetical protein